MDLVKKLFDPSLNLFRRTACDHMYPSPMTSMSEINHLDLMEFSGKMLAKAVYEVGRKPANVDTVLFMSNKANI